MRRWMWILCGILAFQFLERTGTEPEQLKPVQLLLAEKTGERVILKTDTVDYGEGYTVKEALQNMEDSADGRIFLETAELLILKGTYEELLADLQKVLRPAVGICTTEERLDPAKAAEYLSVLRPEHSFLELRVGNHELPQLQWEKGRGKLVQVR